MWRWWCNGDIALLKHMCDVIEILYSNTGSSESDENREFYTYHCDNRLDVTRGV